MKQIKDDANYFVDELGNIYSKKSGNLIKIKPRKKKNGLVKTKKIYQYNLNGDFIREWENFEELNKYNNKYSFSGISTACNDEKKSYKGSLWRYKKYDKLNRHIHNWEKNFKKVNQYDLDNNYLKTWNSIKEIEQFYKLAPGSISRCCNGKMKRCKGYIWKFHNEGSDE